MNGAGGKYQSALEGQPLSWKTTGKTQPKHTPVASSPSKLHACTSSRPGGPSALVDLWSQDTHLDPGIREKAFLLGEDPGKAHILKIPKRYQPVDSLGKGVCCMEYFK